AQFGLNYQNCRNQIFASLDFSFESLYQAIRRSYRFGQKNNVNIYLITTDTMQNVIASINQKQAQFEKMQREMTKSINKNMNNEIRHRAARDARTVETDNYTLMLGDCV